ncbi:hypothetical protein N7540_013025 [Penicillium herquei]|nr:hypothetical protein N7540_013025 [Penicillium herquei]
MRTKKVFMIGEVLDFQVLKIAQLHTLVQQFYNLTTLARKSTTLDAPANRSRRFWVPYLVNREL